MYAKEEKRRKSRLLIGDVIFSKIENNYYPALLKEYFLFSSFIS
jgi:hypothetical protein